MTDREKVINKVTAIVADMQEEVDEWKDYSDSELRGGLTCDCDWWYKTLQTLKDAIVLLKALDVMPEELERLKKCRHECKIDCLLEHYEKIKAERDALLEARDQRWTPITFRALTDEEKEDHPEWCYIIDSPTPEDGEEILVSNGRCVWSDEWGNDGVECYLESGHELEGVAWMKMPDPWKKEADAT